MDMTTLPLPALRQCLDTMALESLFRLGATSTGYADVIAEHKPLRGDAFGLYVEVVGETYGITVAVGVSHQTSLDEGAHFLRKWYAMDGWKQGEVLLRELFSNPLFTALPNKICVSLEYVTIDAALLEQLSCLAHLSELSVHQCPLSDQMAFKSLLDELEPKCLKLKAQEVAETPMITQDFFTSPINRLEMTSPGLGDGTTAVLLALKLEHLDYEETGLFFGRWMKEFVKSWCDGKAPFEKIYVRTGLGVDEERKELLDHLQPHMHECTLHMGRQVLNVTNPMMRTLTPGVFRHRRWETTLRRETDGETALLVWVEREATAGVVFYYPDPRS